MRREQEVRAEDGTGRSVQARDSMKMSGDFSSFMRELKRANISNTTTLFNGLQQQRKDDMAGLNNHILRLLLIPAMPSG